MSLRLSTVGPTTVSDVFEKFIVLSYYCEFLEIKFKF